MPSSPRARALATTLVVAAAATTLAGCSELDRWTAAPVPTAAPSPSTVPPSTPSPATTSPSATPTGSPTTSATPSPTATPSPSATPSATPTASTPAATPSPSASPSATATARASLRRGDSGPEVRALQERLSGLGYWLGPPDGSFGALTQQAVFALQKAAGLSRDGIVGPDTRRALTAGTRPRATLSGNGVEIDLQRQLVMVVRGGEPEIVLNTSTGSGKTFTSKGHTSVAFTPTGTFSVFRQVDGPDDSPLGALWRPKYFHRGWAVHGSPDIPPYAASHGCARLSNAAMDMIWARDLMPIGSRVLVR